VSPHTCRSRCHVQPGERSAKQNGAESIVENKPSLLLPALISGALSLSSQVASHSGLPKPGGSLGPPLRPGAPQDASKVGQLHTWWLVRHEENRGQLKPIMSDPRCTKDSDAPFGPGSDGSSL
jgi:hypothetical protein